MLTQERLKELFHYDPLTGLSTRLVKTGRKAKIGSIAGCLDKSKGYISIRINNKDYYAHRLAVLYMTGKFPECQVDHEDTIKHHNWWDNLRVCNNSQNRENQTKARLDNKSSGLLGVTASNHNTGFFCRTNRSKRKT